jgi:HK97 family phage major capsid protein
VQSEERIYRHLRLDPSKIDREKKTIPIVFSSEYPAMQRAGPNVSEAIKRAAGLKDGELYVEVLDHDPSNVDLTLLRNGGALLDEHNEREQIGVIEDAEISDKVGKAVARCGNDDFATKRFGQMADGIRKHISAGYRYTRFIGREKGPNGREALRFGWKALEISSVAMPADPTIGVVRSWQDLPAVDSPTVQMQTTEQDPASEFRHIAAELKRAWPGNADQIENLHRTALLEKWGLEQFKRSLFELHYTKPAEIVTAASLGVPAGDLRSFSLTRAIKNCIKNDCRVPRDGLERELHDELTRRNLGVEGQGFFCPLDAPVHIGDNRRMTRDMQATVFAQGGAFVPTLLVVPVIEILRNLVICDKLGARTMAGLTGNVVIPRQEAAATAYSVPEIGALTASGQILGQIAMTPHRVGATQNYSKQFVMQSTPDAEAFLRDDLFKVIALQHDRLLLNGQGSADEPLGVMNQLGVNSMLWNGPASYTNAVLMETLARTLNVVGPGAYVSTPAVKGRMKVIPAALIGATLISGEQNSLWKPSKNENESEMNGQPAWDTNQIPNNQVIWGVWDQLIHGIWGGLDVVVDIFTKAVQAEVAVTINTWMDAAVRHPQAFTVSADAGNQ